MLNKYKKTDTNSNRRAVVLGCGYVALVLLVDLLAGSGLTWPFPWSVFRWMLGDLFGSLESTIFDRFDLFKFVFWLLAPVAICWRGMDWRYLVCGRWSKWDGVFVGGLAVLGMGAMFLIPLVPELRQFYPSLSDWSVEARVHFFLTRLVWVGSWLVGWEFMHRYFLLRLVQREPLEPGVPPFRLAQWGWLVVPLFETAYHLQKASLEAVGMFGFSVVLTLWCLKRGNWLLAFVVHLIIEVELLFFMTLVA